MLIAWSCLIVHGQERTTRAWAGTPSAQTWTRDQQASFLAVSQEPWALSHGTGALSSELLWTIDDPFIHELQKLESLLEGVQWSFAVASGGFTSQEHLRKIRRPLFASGTKAAWSGLIVFLRISGHWYSATRLCFYVLRKAKYRHDLPHQIPHLGSVLITKILLFSSLFSRLKNQKNGSQGFQKTITFHKRFPWTIGFCNTFLAETTIRKSQTSNFPFRNR